LSLSSTMVLTRNFCPRAATSKLWGWLTTSPCVQSAKSLCGVPEHPPLLLSVVDIEQLSRGGAFLEHQEPLPVACHIVDLPGVLGSGPPKAPPWIPIPWATLRS
jgi:hypothetical protein